MFLYATQNSNIAQITIYFKSHQYGLEFALILVSMCRTGSHSLLLRIVLFLQPTNLLTIILATSKTYSVYKSTDNSHQPGVFGRIWTIRFINQLSDSSLFSIIQSIHKKSLSLNPFGDPDTIEVNHVMESSRYVINDIVDKFEASQSNIRVNIFSYTRLVAEVTNEQMSQIQKKRGGNQ